MCSAAEKRAKGKYSAIFVNNNEVHHQKLTSILDAGGYLTSADTIYGDAIEQLRHMTESLRDETLFLYIDPFGLDVEFDVLLPLLYRDGKYSTEILINLHMPIIHRLAGRKSFLATYDRDQFKANHEKLTRTFGGDYWKEALLENDNSAAKDREGRLVKLYREKLSSTGYLTFTGGCPVRERLESQTKYYMVFASPHPDAILLLNDTMCKSFQDYMHVQWAKDTFFADSSWSEWRDPTKLQDLVVEYVDRNRGSNRREIWQRIVEDHFMLITSSEYRRAMKANCESNRIICVTPIEKDGIRPTKRLNDKCVFEKVSQQGLL